MASRRRRFNSAMTMIALPGVALGMLAALPVTPAQAQAVGANLKVLSPKAGDALGASSFSLDVSFRSLTSSPVTTTELWVDGVRWVHSELPSPQIKNVLSFAIDASTLSEGNHNLVVRVVCANGTIGETSLQVAAGNNAGAVVGSPDGPDVTFKTPGNGRHVMGQVDLEIDSPVKDGSNPYVTVYIDKQFKTLKNFPPYSYTWDTTAVANGFHTIEATGYLDANKQSTTRSIRVFVDNPGGNTEIKKDIPDLSLQASTAAKTVAIPAVGHSRSAGNKIAAIFTPTGDPLMSDPFTAHVANGVSIARSAELLPIAGIAASHHSATNLLLKALTASVPAHAAHVATEASVLRQRVREAMLESTTDEAAPGQSIVVSSAGLTPVFSATELRATSPMSVAKSATVIHAGAITERIHQVSPSTASPAPASITSEVEMAGMHVERMGKTMFTSGSPKLAVNHMRSDVQLTPMTSPASGVVSPIAAPMMSLVIHHSEISRTMTHTGLRAVLRPSVHGALNGPISKRVTQVAFDGQQIAFDVKPRVESGLPIAPFRQIFEHTGGQVDWVAKTQVVHAVNANREIEITVGKSSAMVNGESVKMDRAAFVEKGRTIVPLSFVGVALDVNVNYDAASGRLQITSK